jgi:8-oxo-dGTP diphosphatase
LSSVPDAAVLPRVPLGPQLTQRHAPPDPPSRPTASFARLLRRVAACRACPTMAAWRKFPASAMGRRNARFVLVGEAPGIASVENGRQWTGTGGMLMRREIRRLGLDLEDLFYLTNAVKCWPAARPQAGRARPGNRSPLTSEARRCQPFLAAELAMLAPEVVVAVGAVAARAVLCTSVRLPDDHGRRYRDGGREVVVLLHPANASRHRAVWPTYRASLLALFGELAARAGFPVVEVTAAVIERSGRFLVTRRDPAKHLGGLWEFPGGKREPGESLEACLEREIREELGTRARVGRRVAVVPWVYPERRVLLHFFRCQLASGAITPREGQPYRWVTRAELAALPTPPADAELVARLAGSSALPTTPDRDASKTEVRGRSRGSGDGARSRLPSRAPRADSLPEWRAK